MGLTVFNKTNDNFLNRTDGRVKTALFLGSIIIATMLNHWYLVAGLWLAAIASYGTLGLSWNIFIKRLLMPIGIAWIVFLNLIFTNGSHPFIIIKIGTISLPAYYEGLYLGILMMMRIMASVSLACVLSFCTPMVEILETLRIWKIPGIIIDIADMMDRYVYIMGETAENMKHAQLSRMGDRRSWRKRIQDTGNAAAYILTKSLDRSIKIYGAMLSRGYNEDSRGADYYIYKVTAADLTHGILIALFPITLMIIDFIK